MLRFEPPSLRDEFIAAARAVKTFTGSMIDLWHWEGIDDPNFDFENAVDEVIGYDSEITLSIPSGPDLPVMPVREFIELALELPSSKLIRNEEYIAPGRALIRVVPSTEGADRFIDHLTHLGITGRWFQHDAEEGVNICLVNGFTAFAVHICMLNDYDDYYPPFFEGSLFLEIKHPTEDKEPRWNRWIPSYLFELEHQTGMGFVVRPRATLAEVSAGMPDESEQYFEALRAGVRLRPLMDGPGVPNVLELYLRAIGQSSDAEQQLVSFVKVLEFIAATVVHMERHEQIRKRLLSPRALTPDATYISELSELFEAMRSFRKDAEALRLTVETCCDVVELARYAPPRLRTLTGISEASSSQERKKALESLAACLTATRNMFSHAKANYTLTGNECTETELPQLIACVRVAAQQAIRWFAASAPSLRVT